MTPRTPFWKSWEQRSRKIARLGQWLGWDKSLLCEGKNEEHRNRNCPESMVRCEEAECKTWGSHSSVWAVYVVSDCKSLPILQRTEESPSSESNDQQGGTSQKIWVFIKTATNLNFPRLIPYLPKFWRSLMPLVFRAYQVTKSVSLWRWRQYLLRKVDKYLPDDTV
jgi:hypothetical protein